MTELLAKITTPSKVFMEAQVSQILLPSSDGEIGILPGHISLICKLEPGVIKTYEGNSVKEKVFVFGGFCSISEDKVNIAVDDAKALSELNLEYAKSELVKSEEILRTESDVEVLDAVQDKILLYRKMIQAITEK